MKICMDTNAYSAFMKRENSKLIELLENTKTIFLPSIVLGELYSGFELGIRYDENCRELEQFLRLPGVEVINIDKDTAMRYGILIRELKSAGTPLPANDIWIGAAAIEKGARLVTYDYHFRFIKGLVIIAP